MLVGFHGLPVIILLILLDAPRFLEFRATVGLLPTTQHATIFQKIIRTITGERKYETQPHIILSHFVDHLSNGTCLLHFVWNVSVI